MEYDKLIEGASEGVMAEKEEIPLGGIPIPSVEEQRNINAELNERMRNPYLRQEGGSHYKDMAIQPITYITRNNIGFAEGNIIKYISRWRNKYFIS